jgi:hypothetical protein
MTVSLDLDLYLGLALHARRQAKAEQAWYEIAVAHGEAIDASRQRTRGVADEPPREDQLGRIPFN